MDNVDSPVIIDRWPSPKLPAVMRKKKVDRWGQTSPLGRQTSHSGRQTSPPGRQMSPKESSKNGITTFHLPCIGAPVLGLHELNSDNMNHNSGQMSHHNPSQMSHHNPSQMSHHNLGQMSHHQSQSNMPSIETNKSRSKIRKQIKKSSELKHFDEKPNIFNPEPVPYNAGGLKHSTVIRRVPIFNSNYETFRLQSISLNLKPRNFVIRTSRRQWTDLQRSHSKHREEVSSDGAPDEPESFVTPISFKGEFNHASRLLRMPPIEEDGILEDHHPGSLGDPHPGSLGDPHPGSLGDPHPGSPGGHSPGSQDYFNPRSLTEQTPGLQGRQESIWITAPPVSVADFVEENSFESTSRRPSSLDRNSAFDAVHHFNEEDISNVEPSVNQLD